MIDYSIQLNTLEFRSVVNELVQNVDEVIETGTFHGDGSTRIFADTGKYVFSIECNQNNYAISAQNLAPYQNVCVLHGLSLSKEHLIKGLLHESFDLDVTYDSKYPKSFYMREISQNVVVENALDLLCNNDRNQLIFLDSAGGVGYLEYLWVMNLPNEFIQHKTLILDDINHIKHYRSVKDLIEKGFDVQVSEDKRFAWTKLSGYERD
jgi:hypothetical protein